MITDLIQIINKDTVTVACDSLPLLNFVVITINSNNLIAYSSDGKHLLICYKNIKTQYNFNVGVHEKIFRYEKWYLPLKLLLCSSAYKIDLFSIK